MEQTEKCGLDEEGCKSDHWRLALSWGFKSDLPFTKITSNSLKNGLEWALRREITRQGKKLILVS